MNRLTVLKILTVALVGLLLFSSGLQAQPTRDRILDDVQITEDTGCAVIQVGFNFPVRYVKHFPYEFGDELRIQLEAIVISPVDEEALFTRESVKPPSHNFAKLVEIVYEGDIVGGPFLTLLFRYPVAFKVKQGANFRSMIIAVPGPEASEPCLPSP